MRLTSILAAAATALIATAGMARDAAPAEQRFVHQGRTYIYTTSAAADGRQVIEGQRLPGGNRFRLVVSRDRVTGSSGGTPVAFRLADARGAAR